LSGFFWFKFERINFYLDTIGYRRDIFETILATGLGSGVKDHSIEEEL